MLSVALYARYSSDNQRDASIEDQLRLCRERADREGWRIVDSYSDRSISGASLIRPGVQALMADAQDRRFDIVLAESLDRISRDQEDIAGIYKRFTFAGVRMVTLSEGDVSELHIGLKGTMGALYLKDLADKTRRGLSDIELTDALDFQFDGMAAFALCPGPFSAYGMRQANPPRISRLKLTIFSVDTAELILR